MLQVQGHRSRDRALMGELVRVQVQDQQGQVVFYREQVLDHLIVLLQVEIQVVLRSSWLMWLFLRRSPRGAGGSSGYRTP